MCVEKQITMTDKNNILYLFDRPTEPIFIGKGDENVSFDVPAEYLVSRSVYYYYTDFNLNHKLKKCNRIILKFNLYINYLWVLI